MHKRLGYIKRGAVAHGPAENAAQHIVAAVVAGDYAVGNQESAGADVVGNYAIGEAGLTWVIGGVGQLFNISN